MSTILLLFPPLDVSRDFIDYPYVSNLGLLQNAAVLRELGHTVVVRDALATKGAALTELAEGRVQMGVSVPELLADLPAADLAIVAYTPFHRPPMREPLLAQLLEALAGKFPLVLSDCYQSGQHVVNVASEQLAQAYPELSAIVRHETEELLPKVVSQLLGQGANGKDSLVSESGGEVRALDELPLPAWDLVDTEAYFEFHRSVMAGLGRPSWAFPIFENTLPLLTSRGCPFRCVHCSSNPARLPSEPKVQRRYSRDYLKKAVAALKAQGAKQLYVLDELVNVNAKHFDVFLDLCEDLDLGFELPNGLRADYLKERHFQRIKQRATTLSISAESGSERVVRDIVKKQLDLQAIEDAAKGAQQAELPLLIHFMIGLPGETAQEINETLEYACGLHDEYGAIPTVQYATPLPGTPLAKLGAEEARIRLPLHNDYNPAFQHEPTLDSAQVPAALLKRFRWTFRQRMEASSGPKKIILNATYRCNNRCTFCATGTRTQFDGDWDVQKEILEDYRRQGVTLLDIDGGEPTLNPNLVKIVRTARALGYQKVNVTTNGRMCSYPQYAAKLMRSGITSLLFSIHGHNAKIHAQNVGVAEAFEQSCEGIRQAVALSRGRVALGANITLTKSNWQHLEATTQLIYDLGLRWFNIQFLTPFGRATSSVCPDTQETANAVMALIDRWRDRMKFQVINLPFCFMPGYEQYLMGDLLKLERVMVFVNNDEVNLFDYLKDRRTKKEKCFSCPHSIFCGGFYELENVPEPTWLIEPSDLVRRKGRVDQKGTDIAAEGQAPSPT